MEQTIAEVDRYKGRPRNRTQAWSVLVNIYPVNQTGTAIGIPIHADDEYNLWGQPPFEVITASFGREEQLTISDQGEEQYFPMQHGDITVVEGYAQKNLKRGIKPRTTAERKLRVSYTVRYHKEREHNSEDNKQRKRRRENASVAADIEDLINHYETTNTATATSSKDTKQHEKQQSGTDGSVISDVEQLFKLYDEQPKGKSLSEKSNKGH